MLLHSEDLVDESVPIKFAAIKSLADWVGSDASNDYICCLAVKGSSFMGSHDRTEREKIKTAAQNSAQLKQRYGKWRSQVKNNPQMNDELHQVGRDGLSDLGYEPTRSFAAIGQKSPDGYECLFTPASCGQDDSVKGNSEPCVIHSETDYRAGGGLRIDIDMTSVETVSQCCSACKETINCKHFTFDQANGFCYMKSGVGNVVKNSHISNLISGDVPT
jgi:hypothetical protein